VIYLYEKKGRVMKVIGYHSDAERHDLEFLLSQLDKREREVDHLKELLRKAEKTTGKINRKYVELLEKLA
jgi:hypothetical protein